MSKLGPLVRPLLGSLMLPGAAICNLFLSEFISMEVSEVIRAVDVAKSRDKETIKTPPSYMPCINAQDPEYKRAQSKHAAESGTRYN